MRRIAKQLAIAAALAGGEVGMSVVVEAATTTELRLPPGAADRACRA